MAKPNYRNIYTKRYFDAHPDLNGSGNSGHFFEYANWLTEKLDFSSSIDVGCGFGWLTRCLSNSNKNAVGCDISTHVVKFLEQNQSDMTIYRDELPMLSNTTDQFDLVTCYHVLEHLAPSDVKESIERLIQISSKYVLIVVPMTDIGNRDGMGDTSHVIFRSRKWWESLFKNKKGKILDLKYDDVFDCSVIFEKEQ